MPDQQHDREYDTPTQPTNTEHTSLEDQAYPLEEAMKAQASLRSAARMPPERFPLSQIVAMLSHEIEALRKQGRPDQEIAAIISGNSVIKVDANCLQRFYAAPKDRHTL